MNMLGRALPKAETERHSRSMRLRKSKKVVQPLRIEVKRSTTPHPDAWPRARDYLASCFVELLKLRTAGGMIDDVENKTSDTISPMVSNRQRPRESSDGRPSLAEPKPSRQRTYEEVVVYDWCRKLILIASESVAFTTEQAIQALGGVSRKTAIEHLNSLVELGKIERFARGRYRRIELPDFNQVNLPR
jgi:hypothetical protein